MRRVLCVGLVVSLGCDDTLTVPARPDGIGASEIRLEPRDSRDEASQVTRFVLSEYPPDRSSLHLFRGALSAYHLGRIAADDLPNTLTEREIGIESWRRAQELVVVPRQSLTLGETYALASSGGLVAEITVRDDAGSPPLMRRLWPPPGSSSEPRAAYCGDGPVASAPERVALEPRGDAQVRRGIAAGVRELDCVVLEATEPQLTGAVLMPPAQLGDMEMEPVPWLIGNSTEPAATSCHGNTVGFGPVCASIGDDRMQVEAADEFLLAVRGEEATWAGIVGPVPTTLKILVPGRSNSLDVTAFDREARRWQGRVIVEPSPPTSHVVINEALANPIGAEPAQEWVELYNDGRDAADLEGFILEDSGGSVEFPPCQLGPGQFLLLVSEGFDERAAFDVRPATGTQILRVPELGSSGLRNTGEPLVLRTPSGSACSSFPGLATSGDGVSLARLTPSSPDFPGAFADHGEPGASPGKENVF